MCIIGFLDRLKKSKREPETRSEPLRPGVQYFVTGWDVTFKLNDMDYTHNKFYASFDETLVLEVKNEAAMNLEHLLTVVSDEVGVRMKDVQEADKLDFSLHLKPEIFQKIGSRFEEFSDILDLFDLEHEDEQALKDLANYTLEGYHTQMER